MIAALCSWVMFMSLLASSTMGAEKRAPPKEGSKPKKAGIIARVNLALEKIRCNALTIPSRAPLVRN